MTTKIEGGSFAQDDNFCGEVEENGQRQEQQQILRFAKDDN